jgi:hypothetical protein
VKFAYYKDWCRFPIDPVLHPVWEELVMLLPGRRYCQNQSIQFEEIGPDVASRLLAPDRLLDRLSVNLLTTKTGVAFPLTPFCIRSGKNSSCSFQGVLGSNPYNSRRSGQTWRRACSRQIACWIGSR